MDRNHLAKRMSELSMLIPPADAALDLDEARRRLQQGGLSVSRFRPMPAGHAEVELSFLDRDTRWRCTVGFADLSEKFESAGAKGRMTVDQIRKLGACRRRVYVRVPFEGEPLADFHRQLRIVTALCPTSPALYDATAYRFHSGQWARDAADASVPPPTDSLFIIHAVFEGENAWLHTHGLERAGIRDLEIAGVPFAQVSLLQELVNQLAPIWIETAMPPEEEPFVVQDGILLSWWSGTEAAALFARHGVDPAPRDPDHLHDSAVLFAARADGVAQPITTLLPRLGKVRTILIPHGEGNRLRALSRERFQVFRKLFAQYAGQSGWHFGIKLRLETEQDEERPTYEHAWFQVRSLARGAMVGELSTELRGRSRLQRGKPTELPLDAMSDWQIASPRGAYGPDKVLELQRGLSDESAAGLH